MRCPRCQHANPAAQKFCGECGARLAAVCPSCRAPNSPSQNFCGECGTALGPAATAKPPSPESYTPKHLAERILTSKAALEGERKQVTVLFADVRGSMELVADRDPEEARQLLDPVLEHMMEAVHRYEGTVNQVMGDGIMALFGAPLAHEDHAIRACYAALRMQESVKRYAEGVFRTHGVPVRIRVGLNSGAVVVRSIGSDLHMDYTAVGQTTHLAARMEQIADPGTTRLTADTLRLAEGFVQVQPLGSTPVKGLPKPVEVYELTAASPVRSRLQATAARGLTKFVGRDGEMAMLFGALEQAQAGRGQVVAIVGEPGVGKSRLVWEFTHSHRTDGCLVLEAPSVSYGKATTYLPLIDLVKQYAGIEPRDDGRKIREKVTGKLFSLDRALEPWLAPLLWLLDARVDDAEWERLDPGLRRQRLHEALRRLLLREAREQPLVVVFEDLHWIDGETQAVLDGLVERLPAARICLLVNYRPEYRHGWSGKTFYTQVRLDALQAVSAAELLTAVLGSDPSVGPLVPLLIARTEGNPFYLEETVRTLAEAGALAGQRGTYRLMRRPEALDIPATAQAILSARIDRLAPEDKRLLQTAAVVGKDVPYLLLEAVADVDEAALRAGLARLQAAEFLYETRLFPESEYTFKHALTHNVAYGGLLQDRRRVLHGRLVDAIERLFPERLAEHIEPLAHHATRGELHDKAVTYLIDVGSRALAYSANREAVERLQAALEVLDRIPPSPTTLARGIDVRLQLRSALQPLGEVGSIVRYLNEAREHAVELRDDRRLGLVASFLANYFWISGQPARARREAERAYDLAATCEDLTLAVAAREVLGRIAVGGDDDDRSEPALREALHLLAARPTFDRLGHNAYPHVLCRVWLGSIVMERGDYVEALQLLTEAVELAKALDPGFSLSVAYYELSLLRCSMGEFAEAFGVADQALALGRERGFPILLPLCRYAGGQALIGLGRMGEATAWLEEALGEVDRMGFLTYRTMMEVRLGEAALAARDIERARAAGDRALAAAREREESRFEPWARQLAGAVASLDSATYSLAEDHYSSALSLAEKFRMRPLVAHCHRGLAKLHRSTGKRTEAQQHLTTATTMYREMGMTFCLELMETEPRQKG